MCLVMLVLFATAFERTGHFHRYYYPIAALGYLAAYSALFGVIPARGRARYLRMALYLLLCAQILLYGFRAIQRSKELPEIIMAAFGDRTRFTAEEIERYRRLQASAPPGAPIFSILSWPVKFDLRRNKIYYHEPVGSSSPPPGIPRAGQPDALGDYLRCLGIHHVACPSRQELAKVIAQLNTNLVALKRRPEIDEWVVSIIENDIRVGELFGELARRRAVLFDDGAFTMIDLDSRVAAQE
jgi:hypothetical protein